MTTIINLSKLDSITRNGILSSCRSSGWQVIHQPVPSVHPDKKSSLYYYSFSVKDSLDRIRQLHSNNAKNLKAA